MKHHHNQSTLFNFKPIKWTFLLTLGFTIWLMPLMAAGEGYPKARKDVQINHYHGIKVEDPYRWMEDMTSVETTTWIDAQEKFFDQKIESQKRFDKLHQHIVSIGTHARFGMPQKVGGKVFFTYRAIGKQQSVLLVQRGLQGPKRELLPSGPDPIWGYKASPDGKYLTFKRRHNGSPWGKLHILDVDSGKVLNESVSDHYGNGGGVDWAHDSQSFFYVNFDALGDKKKLGSEVANAQIFRHVLGTPSAEDQKIYSRPDLPKQVYNLSITDDGRYLVIAFAEGAAVENGVLVLDLQAKNGKPKSFIPPIATFNYLGNKGSVFWFHTNHQATRGKIIAVDLKRSGPENWETLLAESGETLQSVVASGGHFVTLASQDARIVMKTYRLDGKLAAEVKLPFLGNAWSIGGTPSDDKEVFFSLNSLFHPGAIFRLNLPSGKVNSFLEPEMSYDPSAYVMSQVFYRSKDGTRVPMFVAHRKNVAPSENTPVFMYAYGAYGWSAFPWFQAHMVAWMDLGGVYAMPGIRGGGEYGNAWHQGGIRANKGKGLEDYLAAAKWLIENKYTSVRRLIANGGSASGLLPGAAINQKPELFGAAVIDIPSLDLLRFDKFGMGKYRLPEYGSPEDPNEFKVLHQISPYHNLRRDICYPPVLVTVCERDETAVPMHGYKYIAALQGIQKCKNPAYLKVVRGAGHTFGKTPKQAHHTMAAQLTFLSDVLGLDMPSQFAALNPEP